MTIGVELGKSFDCDWRTHADCIDTMNSLPQISLVVVTRNRPVPLQRLIVSLMRQSLKSMEVIVIDQSDSEQRATVRELVRSCAQDLNLRLIEDSERGLSRGRNLGLSMVQGEIIGFPDDDCWYADELVQQVVAWFQENCDYDFLAVPFTEPGVPNAMFPTVERDITYWRGGVVGVCSVGLFFRQQIVRGRNVLFAENLGAGRELMCSEETDFVFRCVHGGSRGRFVPSITVFHPIKTELWDCGRILQVDKARSYVFYKNRTVPEAVVRLVVGLLILTARALGSKEARERLVARIDGVMASARDRHVA
jgi:glycosyltransferase involved in cell wall biosynthesis